jgi:hypothetical protein
MKSFDVLTWRGRMTVVVGVALASFAATLALANRASAAAVNTFQGNCAGLLGTASWSSPLHTFPAPLQVIVRFEGGSCSGSLNGEQIDGVPLRDGYVDAYGLMSCSEGVGDGRAAFTIGGRSFTGAAHYRRSGLTPVVYIEGDTSGYLTAVAHAVAGPGDIVSLAEQCGSEGLSQAEVMIETFSAPLGISSPQR